MRYFLTSFRTQLQLQLRTARFWLLILLLPAAVFAAVKLIPAREAAAPVQVGVALPRGDRQAEEFWRRLDLRSGTVVTFIAADADEVERNVAAARWDCGIIVPEDFSQRLSRLDTRRILTVVTGPGSVVYPVVQETAAVCLAEQIAPLMAEDYLLSSGIAEAEQMPALSAALEEILPEEQRVLIRLKTLSGDSLTVEKLADSGLDTVLAAGVAILLLLWCMFTAMDLGRWLQTPFARRLRPVRGVTALLLPRAAAAMVPAFLSGGAAALLLARPLRYLTALVPYLLLLMALALLAARLPAVWGAFPVLMPFVPALALLLSPVIVDASRFLPVLGRVSACMPVTLYLKSSAGEASAILAQLAAAAVLVLALLAADGCSRRKTVLY